MVLCLQACFTVQGVQFEFSLGEVPEKLEAKKETRPRLLIVFALRSRIPVITRKLKEND